MADIANLVRQTSASTGAGTLMLANVNGYRSFNVAFGTGGADKFYYFIAHRAAAEWEYGTGHLSDATTLVRDTVLGSSNANAAVAFSAGTKDVMNDLPAEFQVNLADLGTAAFQPSAAFATAAQGARADAALPAASAAPVATSGDYNDLLNRPSIPPAQVPADWDATTGVARILNKPSAFPPTAHTHNAGDINAGTLAIARIPTGTAANTVALGNHTHGAATTGAPGFMSAADKAKLDGIPANATANTGTVTSVALSVPTGFSVAGSPVTSAGTFTVSYASGYQGYTTAEAGKLSGIEAGADVTDAANVAAAGAAMLAAENQALTGGATVTSKSLGTITTGTVTLDMGDRPLQHLTRNGAFTLAPGSVNGMCVLDITNGASAGALTTSGWTQVAGDDFTTTNGHKFRCHCSVGNGGSLLVVQALQ